ncbi:HD-GYP domain-containing protein [Balneola vulgaris]|uniref:HD-GYP domain-containing protein n=1 Tax=Balneola vulgaris TaxID=287535 RepID=UPI00036AE6E7|nr:HD domain-containing phosphohydrolase [Balneola vulgaris]
MGKDVKKYFSTLGNRLGKAFSIESFGTEEELEFWSLSAEHLSRKEIPSFQNLVEWMDLLYSAPVHFVYKKEGDQLVLTKRFVISENLYKSNTEDSDSKEAKVQRQQFVENFENQFQNLQKKREWEDSFNEFGVSAHTIGNCEHIPLFTKEGIVWGLYVVGPYQQSPESMRSKLSIVGRLLANWLIELDEEEQRSAHDYENRIKGVVGDLGSGALNTKGIAELMVLYILNSIHASSGAVIEYKDDKPTIITSVNVNEEVLKHLSATGVEPLYTFNNSDNTFSINENEKHVLTEHQLKPLIKPFIDAEIKGLLWLCYEGDSQPDFDPEVLNTINSILGNLLSYRNQNHIFSDQLIESFYLLLRALEKKRSKTYYHTPRLIGFVSMFGVLFGLDQDEMETIKLTAKLHDIGYVGAAGISSIASVGSELAHPIAGATMLSSLPVTSDVIEGIKTHHEWVNGQGAPNGLTGVEIPWTGKIIGVFEYIVDFIESSIEDSQKTDDEYLQQLADNLIERADKQFDMVLIPTVIQLIQSLGWQGCVELGVEE